MRERGGGGEREREGGGGEGERGGGERERERVHMYKHIGKFRTHAGEELLTQACAQSHTQSHTKHTRAPA